MLQPRKVSSNTPSLCQWIAIVYLLTIFLTDVLAQDTDTTQNQGRTTTSSHLQVSNTALMDLLHALYEDNQEDPHFLFGYKSDRAIHYVSSKHLYEFDGHAYIPQGYQDFLEQQLVSTERKVTGTYHSHPYYEPGTDDRELLYSGYHAGNVPSSVDIKLLQHNTVMLIGHYNPHDAYVTSKEGHIQAYVLPNEASRFEQLGPKSDYTCEPTPGVALVPMEVYDEPIPQEASDSLLAVIGGFGEHDVLMLDGQQVVLHDYPHEVVVECMGTIRIYDKSSAGLVAKQIDLDYFSRYRELVKKLLEKQDLTSKQRELITSICLCHG